MQVIFLKILSKPNYLNGYFCLFIYKFKLFYYFKINLTHIMLKYDLIIKYFFLIWQLSKVSSGSMSNKDNAASFAGPSPSFYNRMPDEHNENMKKKKIVLIFKNHKLKYFLN